MKKALMILLTAVALGGVGFTVLADCYDHCEMEYAGIDWDAYNDCMDMCDNCPVNGEECF
ncbi:MAG: hypothetical protein QNK37_23490 [Acidobacteriota bacterium]|nr:hypothetical protein [Acidobacteriota bacterium]